MQEACNHEVQQSAQQFFFVWDHHATKLQASLPGRLNASFAHISDSDTVFLLCESQLPTHLSSFL